jgi:putative nucleotide binding protein
VSSESIKPATKIQPKRYPGTAIASALRERELYSSSVAPKKYEEFAYVLDFVPRGKSFIIREREGPLVQAIGQEHLNLLEILVNSDSDFVTGEKISIGKDNRTRVVSVLGKLNYDELSSESKNELQFVLEKLILENEIRYVAFFNELQPLTPRLHALELIPGIGKTFMKQIVAEREKHPFESFADLERRVGVRDPSKLLAKRIVEELSGGSRITLFIRR